jgi:alkylation response protein AidB-like acyl-CoA dehydrogenase
MSNTRGAPFRDARIRIILTGTYEVMKLIISRMMGL